MKMTAQDRAWLLQHCRGVTVLPVFDRGQLERLASRGLITFAPDPSYWRTFGRSAMRIVATAHGRAVVASIRRGGSQ